MVGEQSEQVRDVVGALKLDLVRRENRLDPLLDGLLGVEPDHFVRDIRVLGEILKRGLIARGLIGRIREGLFEARPA